MTDATPANMLTAVARLTIRRSGLSVDQVADAMGIPVRRLQFQLSEHNARFCVDDLLPLMIACKDSAPLRWLNEQWRRHVEGEAAKEARRGNVVACVSTGYYRGRR